MEAVVALLGTLMVLMIGALIGVYVFVNKIANTFANGLHNINKTLNDSLTNLYEKMNHHIADTQAHTDSREFVSKEVCVSVQKTNAALLEVVKANQAATTKQIDKMDLKLDTVLEKLGDRK